MMLDEVPFAIHCGGSCFNQRYWLLSNKENENSLYFFGLLYTASERDGWLQQARDFIQF